MLVIDGVEVMGVREAADRAGRTPETIRRWVWSGRLSARRRGNQLMIARSELDAVISPTPSGALTLAEWQRLLPATRPAHPMSAADLVLDDRRDREAGHDAGR